MDKHIQQQPGQNQYVNLESDCLGMTERSDPNLNDSFQNDDAAAKNDQNNMGHTGGGYPIGTQGSAMMSTQQYQLNTQYMHASHSPTTLGYPYADRLKTTDINPLTMSENTLLEKNENNFMHGSGGHSYPNNEAIAEQNHPQTEDS